MPISSNGSKLTVQTIIGDETVVNADSVNPTYNQNQQREAKAPILEGCMQAVYGKNILLEEDRIVDTPATDAEAVTAANEQDLKKRNL